MLDFVRDFSWVTVLWEPDRYMDGHPWRLGIILACAAVITLGVGPLFSLLGAANTFDRTRKTLTNEGNLAYILTTPLSDAELFWSMVKGSLFSQLSFSITAIAVAIPLALFSMLMGVPALYLLVGVILSLGVPLLGTFLLSVVSACTGPERWRSFWVSILALTLATADVVGPTAVMSAVEYTKYALVGLFVIAAGVLVVIPLSLGFFKAGLNGIRHYRAADVDVKTA